MPTRLFPATLDLLRCPCCPEPKGLRIRTLLEVAPDGEVIQAVLEADCCARWFRVEEGIADLVRDGLREVDDELAFLTRHAAALGPAFIGTALPHSIGRTMPLRSEADERIVQEGRHWGRFMRRFWEVGDRSIFDLRAKGSHPPFYVKGVLDRDDRDGWKRWGVYPLHAGDALFSWLHQFAGKRAIDSGCGGGQFGLEAAYQGVLVTGCDPSFEELVLGRRYARSVGITTIDYVRGEPAYPPFADGVFDLVMAKDSLHHVPDLDVAFPRLLRTGIDGAHVVCFEHIANSRWKARLFAALMPWLHRRILERGQQVLVPEDLLRDSANEDISAHLVEPVMRRHVEPLTVMHILLLAEELETAVHFAFGKRRWLSRIVYTAAWWLEQGFKLIGDRQHLVYHGIARPRG